MDTPRIRTAADWIPVFRARIAALDLTHREIDHLAGLPDGYMSKILAGMYKPGAETIERLCGALALTLVPVVDAEREAAVRAEAMRRRRA